MSAKQMPGQMIQSFNIIRDTNNLGAIADNSEIARRLAACWNACEGLPTDLLENITLMGDTLHSRFRLREQTERELIAQRDALRDAAKNALNALQICGMKFEHVEAELRAAIAQAIC